MTQEVSASELTQITKYCQDSSDEMLLEELKYVEIFKDNEVYYLIWKAALDQEAKRRGLL